MKFSPEPYCLLGAPGKNALKLPAGLALQLQQAGEQGRAVRAEQFGCGRRCWRTQIGGEVGYGEIGLMADTGDDREAAGADGACHDLFVE